MPPPSLDLILGPILMGTIVNVFLFGIMVLQCFLYYLRHKQDRIAIKLTVVFLLFVDAISSAFDVAMTYQYLVTSFGNFEKIGIVNVGVTPYPLLSGITSFVVQVFFAWRVSILTERAWLGGVICVLSFIQMLASIGTTIGGHIIKELAKLEKLEPVALTWLFIGVATDLLITSVLVFHLRRRRTGFAATDDIISRIIRFTIQTGILTSACALAVAITYIASTSALHLAFGIPLSKLYTNSLMSTLNMRQGWGNKGLISIKLSETGRDSDSKDITFGVGSTAASAGTQNMVVSLSRSRDVKAPPGDTYELRQISVKVTGETPMTDAVNVHTEVDTYHDPAGAV